MWRAIAAQASMRDVWPAVATPGPRFLPAADWAQGKPSPPAPQAVNSGRYEPRHMLSSPRARHTAMQGNSPALAACTRCGAGLLRPVGIRASNRSIRARQQTRPSLRQASKVIMAWALARCPWLPPATALVPKQQHASSARCRESVADAWGFPPPALPLPQDRDHPARAFDDPHQTPPPHRRPPSPAASGSVLSSDLEFGNDAVTGASLETPQQLAHQHAERLHQLDLAREAYQAREAAQGIARLVLTGLLDERLQQVGRGRQAGRPSSSAAGGPNDAATCTRPAAEARGAPRAGRRREHG